MLNLIVGLHLMSYHANRADTLNAETFGVYALDRRSGFGAGVLRNSYDRTSVHADWTAPVLPNVDLTFGLITGYPKARVLPLFAPSVHTQRGPWAARLTFSPGVRGGSPALHFSIERSIAP